VPGVLSASRPHVQFTMLHTCHVVALRALQ